MAGAGSILLVEDDRDIRESIADALEEEGYSVTSAIDGIDALEKLRGGTLPQVILLDLMMPRMSGQELFEHVKQVREWRQIPIVLLTADANARSKAEALGAPAYLKKPVTLDQLFQTVARILEGTPAREGETSGALIDQRSCGSGG